MDFNYQIIDNIELGVFAQKITISLIIVTSVFLFGYLVTKSNEDSDTASEEELDLEKIRNYIESYSDNSEEYKVFQSILLPKKGDYVELTKGRWKKYIGRITNIINTESGNKFNIKVHIKDNINYGSDIPHYLLKNKDRDFFSVLTDKEIESYDLLDDNEYFDRYYTQIYN